MKRCPEGGACRFTRYEHDLDGKVSCEKCGSEDAPSSEMELAFRLIESAIDAHPKLSRVEGTAGEPIIVMCRAGVSITIAVTLGACARPSEISGEGLSVPAAAAHLVSRLETWWVAWLCGLRSLT